MNRSLASQNSRVPWRAVFAPADSFALAAERLRAQRPLRERRLRRIAEDLANRRVELAEKCLAERLASDPDNADALFLMARTQFQQGRHETAASLLGRCVEIAPDFAAARFSYAETLVELDNFESGLEQLDRLLAQDENNPLFRQLKANVLETIGENESSLAINERLAAENPGRADSWISYGHGLRAMGFQEKAVAAYRRAIEIRPSCGPAYWALANMKTVRFGGADIDAMEAQMTRTGVSPGDRVQIQYALGKAYEDRGSYEMSFERYAKAGAAMRVRIPYDPENVTKLVTGAKTLFTPEFLQSREGAGCSTPGVIFVVGLPRSGSTLIEQILCSHPAIEAAEELPYITDFVKRLENREGAESHVDYATAIRALAPADFKAMGEEYLERTRIHRKLGRPFFIDKKPPNFFHLGLIRLILPNAKIIDARRHPVACCFSQFRQYLKKKARPRLAELGDLYRNYIALMAHFDSVLPGWIHRVIYEDTVRDPEAEVRKLLDYIGLPFEERCLRFYETERAILTPSSEQVRRPITSDAVDYWRNFEPWLGPLIESLGSAFAAYPDVPQDLR